MPMSYQQRIASDPQYRGVPPGMLILHRFGGWLPRDHRVLEKWLSKRITTIDERHKKGTKVALDPVLQQFKTVIETDPAIYMGFHEMFTQVPDKPPYDKDPTGKPQVRDYKLMLELFNEIIKKAPEWEDDGLVGFPVNAIIDWPMGTPAGFSMFTNDDVNQQFKNMFDVWVKFLTSLDSRYVIPDWIPHLPNFTDLYVCDPQDPYYGYQSWDDFFTRRFKDGVRPVDPDDNTITSACESAFLARVPNVKERDQFWLKGQPYSLADILDYNTTYVDQFANGTVYQAFLSATKYHRWHSPVNGVIEDVFNVPGTYYAESPTAGFDPSAPDLSQAFITAMAARAIIYIRSTSSAIGLVCLVAVGMSEVSSCEVTVQKGQTVKKGDQIGMFHFGGSTHCLIFTPDAQAKLQFVAREQHDDVLLNEVIANVVG
ncbi:phosphatidylserine decarboxylase-domain-containing protein [Cerioporus squamosus]|nr:phosphatidylserine decarboxylase-domain-containing protein [Cerioporus squamosus]